MASNSNRKAFYRNYCYSSMISETSREANYQEVESQKDEANGLSCTVKSGVMYLSDDQNFILVCERNLKLQDEAAETSVFIPNNAILYYEENVSEGHLIYSV